LPGNVSEIFAQRFSMARDSEGLTQQQLSEELGVDVRMIRMYESASSFPRPNVLNKLTSLTNRPIAWFFQEEDEKKEPRQVTPAEALSVLEGFVKDAQETDRLRSELAEARARIAQLEAQLDPADAKAEKPSRIARVNKSLIGSRRQGQQKNERRRKS